MDFLNENAVVAHTCAALAGRRWIIDRYATTSQTGIDIVGSRGAARIYVEAKGVTSSKAGTKRYGKKQNSSQVAIQIATAFLKTAELRASHPNAEVAIALPDHAGMRGRIERIAPILQQSRIGVMWVREDGHVAQWNTTVLSSSQTRP
jgi:hypothetical protein